MAVSFGVSAQFGTELYSDDFSESSAEWQAVGLDNSKGAIEIFNGVLNVTLEQGERFGGYYAGSSFSGHFEVVVDIDQDHGVGLALIKEVNGEPSFGDYSMITVNTNDDDIVEIKLTDSQGGSKDILDNTYVADRSRYTQLVSGDEYSIPYDQTAKKLRILRHEKEQFLHFYYAVEKQIKGEVFLDWMELAPSKEWGTMPDDYFIGVFSLEGTVRFDNILVNQLPLIDRDDTGEGFKITERPYTWTGYTDDALVVTFGNQFPFANEDRKFVFWELANNIPVWHLNSSSLFTYGFVETWGGGNPGCHEPMSDRLLGHSDLEIIENNDVRKVVKWSYDLINPDYKVPTHDQGEQLPEATEYYFIYADGSVVRKIQYAPKLDSDFRNWHEVMELMVIAGENQRPGNLLEYPSLTFHELGRDKIEFNNESETSFRNNNQRLGATTMTAHVENAPDLFTAFSDDVTVPETYTGLPLNYEVTWHDRKHNFGHWPVNKEPYVEPCKSWSTWPQQLAHTSLVGMGIDLGQDWQNNFLEREDGRKYRQWLSILGMNAKNMDVTVEDKTNSWLFPGDVEMLNDSAIYVGYSHEDKYFEFETALDKPACYFTASPKTKLVNPILRINQWGDNLVYVNMNGKPLEINDYVINIDENGDLLLLITGAYVGEVRFEISSQFIPESIVLDVFESSQVQVYPNPSDSGFVNINLPDKKTARITVLSASGKQVLEDRIQSGRYLLDTSNLKSGIYIIQIEQERRLVTKKLVVR